MNFDQDFTKAERDEIIARRKRLRNRADGVAYTTADLDDLRKGYLDLIRLGIDDSQLSADDREYSRSLNDAGVPNAPEYRHEFLMGSDNEYHVAWAYEFSESFRARADADPSTMQSVERSRASHAYFERDPEIVDRSLLRNGYRSPREGEGDPPPVVGRFAPRILAVLPSTTRSRVVPALTG